MKQLFLVSLFLCSLQFAKSQTINAAEFFVDTDPGAGNGTPVTITPGSTATFVATVPTTLLPSGFHFVAIRTKDFGGSWGMFENRGFFISSVTTNVGNITGAEFFVDTDPGAGSGTPIAVPAGSTATFAAVVPTASLASGFHFIAIRTRDISGKWSLFENRGFYISNTSTNVGNITAAEFFVDTDPGAGNGMPITVPAGSTTSFVAMVPSTLLTNGFHFVAIRTKDASGNWGLFENRGFFISTVTNNMANITTGEYFFDTDPGIGNGLPFNFTTPGSTVTQALALNIPAGLSIGNHLLVLRVKDANNIWSLFDTARTLNVSGSVVPLNLLSFTGKKLSDKTQLDWVTNNEINTAHFEIERSKNGIEFTKIGVIKSTNAVRTNLYMFNDLKPIDGVNFYRLKQVDLDGKFTYSNIIKILFEGFGKALSIYPNPAQNYVLLNFSDKQKNVFVSVFDAQGRQVIQTTMANQSPLKLNINHLPGGKYFIQISDGLVNENGSFIKK